MAYSKSSTMHLCACYMELPHVWKEVNEVGARFIECYQLDVAKYAWLRSVTHFPSSWTNQETYAIPITGHPVT